MTPIDLTPEEVLAGLRVYNVGPNGTVYKYQNIFVTVWVDEFVGRYLRIDHKYCCRTLIDGEYLECEADDIYEAVGGLLKKIKLAGR